MASLGVLKEVLPEGAELGRLRAYLSLERRFDLAPEPLPRLASLIPWPSGLVTALARRMKLSNKSRDWLESSVALARSLERDSPPIQTQALEGLLHHRGSEQVTAALLLHWAAAADGGEAPSCSSMTELWAHVRAWCPKAFPI